MHLIPLPLPLSHCALSLTSLACICFLLSLWCMLHSIKHNSALASYIALLTLLSMQVRQRLRRDEKKNDKEERERTQSRERKIVSNLCLRMCICSALWSMCAVLHFILPSLSHRVSCSLSHSHIRIVCCCRCHHHRIHESTRGYGRPAKRTTLHVRLDLIFSLSATSDPHFVHVTQCPLAAARAPHWCIK